MRSNDPLYAAIDAKLARIAELAPSPPPWYDGWSRLGSEAGDEDRLAVYRAVRQSRCIPAIAAFALVAWQIENIVEQAADGNLRDLEERLRAMELAWEREKGEPWRGADVPEEYAELSRQYDEAWDRVYPAMLERCGEGEMAELYRDAPEEFDRQCDLGLRFFDERVTVRKPLAPDDLVAVASCLDLPRADLVRMALARQGIPVALENANFLYWNWDHSNAVGGVKVYVRAGDAQRADEVLAGARAKPTRSLSPWTCSHCGQRVAGRWNACWRCGLWMDGTAGEPLAGEGQPRAPGEAEPTIWHDIPKLFGVAAGVLVVLVLLAGGRQALGPALILALCAAVIVLLLRRFEALPGGEPERERAAGDGDHVGDSAPVTRSAVAQASVRRAWQAAVIAVLSFPPLGFYSLRLLWKVCRRATPLSRADRRRCWMALLFNVATVVFCLGFAAMLFLAAAGALRPFLR
jgi:hypothetical protein